MKPIQKVFLAIGLGMMSLGNFISGGVVLGAVFGFAALALVVSMASDV